MTQNSSSGYTLQKWDFSFFNLQTKKKKNLANKKNKSKFHFWLMSCRFKEISKKVPKKVFIKGTLNASIILHSVLLFGR